LSELTDEDLMVIIGSVGTEARPPIKTVNGCDVAAPNTAEVIRLPRR
jgi:hypothetical protein